MELLDIKIDPTKIHQTDTKILWNIQQLLMAQSGVQIKTEPAKVEEVPVAETQSEMPDYDNMAYKDLVQAAKGKFPGSPMNYKKTDLIAKMKEVWNNGRSKS